MIEFLSGGALTAIAVLVGLIYVVRKYPKQYDDAIEMIRKS